MQARNTLTPLEHHPGHRRGLATVERSHLWVGSALVELERYTPSQRVPAEPTVVFLHGWGMAHRGYRAGLSAMAVRGVQVDAYALPGYAGSHPLPLRGCGLVEHARRLAAALEQAAYDHPVHLVGHSFGGGIALTLAAIRPDLVDRLTAVCPVGGAAAGRPAWSAVARAFLTEGGTSGMARFLRSFGPALGRSPLTVAASGLAARNAALTQELQQALAGGVDVHLVFADADAVMPAGRLAHPSYGARVTTVAGGHSWLHQHPQEWADLTLGREAALGTHGWD